MTDLIRHRHRLMCFSHTQVRYFIVHYFDHGIYISQEELLELKQTIVDLIDQGTR